MRKIALYFHLNNILVIHWKRFICHYLQRNEEVCLSIFMVPGSRYIEKKSDFKGTEGLMSMFIGSISYYSLVLYNH